MPIYARSKYRAFLESDKQINRHNFRKNRQRWDADICRKENIISNKECKHERAQRFVETGRPNTRRILKCTVIEKRRHYRTLGARVRSNILAYGPR